MNLVRLETQPEFPDVDLSDENEAMLELLLRNSEVLDRSHRSAELVNYLFQLGHTTLTAVAAPYFDDRTRLAAFSHGIATYETMSAFVNPARFVTDPSQVNLHVMSEGSALSQGFIAAITRARDHLDAFPRTKHVIEESAGRAHKSHTDYAVSGAALARELEATAPKQPNTLQ